MNRSHVRRSALGVSVALTLALFAVLPLAGQSTGSIRATVTDAVTARPLTGAQVSIQGTGLGGLANSSGQVLILNVPVGTQTVVSTLLGYSTVEETVNVTAGQVATVNIAMQTTALELDELVVRPPSDRSRESEGTWCRSLA